VIIFRHFNVKDFFAMKFSGMIAAAGAALLLPACANFGTAVDFKPSPLSGIEGSKTMLILTGPDYPNDNPSTPLLGLPSDANLAITLKDKCGLVLPPPGPAPAVAPALVPILAALAEAGFNIWAEKKQRIIEAIVASAKADYATTQVLSPDMLAKTKCAVMVRYTQEEGKPSNNGLVAVVRFSDQGAQADGSFRAFRIEPIHVQMWTSAAVTADATEPKTSVAIAVSIKAVGTPEGGVQRLLASGEGVTSVPNVKVGGSFEPRCRSGGCKWSDLIPYPTARGSLSLTLAVAEQGNTGFDDKAALAELAAVKAALGPAIGEAVKKKLGD
jgi:hypothetical protein